MLSPELRPSQPINTEVPQMPNEDKQGETTEVVQIEAVFTQERFPTGVSLDEENPLALSLKAKMEKNEERRIAWSEFMEDSLFDPKFGYYTSNVDIGRGRDFSTCPEDLPSFGGHVGQSLLGVWAAMDTPSEFQIVEMGAGTGSLAYSLLEWAKKEQPQFYEAIQYKLIEQSPKLIGTQRQKLSSLNVGEIFPRNSKVIWIEGSAIDLVSLGVSEVEGAIISNELPDAFPVERIIKLENGEIVQKYMTIENNKWVEVWGEPSGEVTEYINEYGYDEIEEGVEEPINLAAVAWQRNIGNALKRGAIVTIDYGEDNKVGIRGKAAIKNFGRILDPKTQKKIRIRRFEDMFASYKSLGTIDITADINFGVLKKIARQDGLDIAFSGEQSEFLLRNGLGEEIKKLRDLCKTTMDLNDLIIYEKAVKVTRDNGFYALMATKRINATGLLGEKPMDEFKYPKMEISVPGDRRQIRIDTESKGKPKSLEMWSDSLRNYSIRRKDLHSIKIYEMSGEVIFDSSKGVNRADIGLLIDSF